MTSTGIILPLLDSLKTHSLAASFMVAQGDDGGSNMSPVV